MTDNPGGQTSAVAVGIIRLGVAQLEADKRQVVAIFQQVSRSGEQIGDGVERGAARSEKALGSLRGTVGQVIKEFGGLLALGGLTNLTMNVQKTNALMVALSGSQEKAARNQETLRELAERTNQPFQDILASSTALLPTIGRTNVDLAKTVSIVQRLAILDPAQGIEGASFAIRELLSGTYTSLASRFEMSRTELQQLVKESGGDPAKIIEGLDEMVNQMGLTEQSMIEMGESGANAFGVLRSEVTELTANAFAPFLNEAIIPAVEFIADLVKQIRELDSELATTAGTLAGFIALYATLSRTPGIGAMGAGNLAVYGGAAYLGGQAGVAVSRGLAETGVINRPDLENVSQADAANSIETTFKQLLVAAADGFTNYVGVMKIGAQTVENAFNEAGLVIEVGAKGIELGLTMLGVSLEQAPEVLRSALLVLAARIEQGGGAVQNAFAGLVVSVGKLIEDLPGDFGLDQRGQDLQNAGADLKTDTTAASANLEAASENLKDAIDALDPRSAEAVQQVAAELGGLVEQLQNNSIGLTPEQADAIVQSIEAMRENFVGGLFNSLFPQEASSQEATASGLTPNNRAGYTQEQMDSWTAYQEALTAIDTQAQEARLSQEQAYQDNRVDLETRYQATLTREAEDEAQRRAAAERKLNQNVEAARTDGGKREQQIILDHTNRINDIRQDYQETETDRLTKHTRALEQINTDSWRKRLDAAARLDARALFEEMSASNTRKQATQETFDRETEDRKTQLQRRLEDETAEHTAKLAANRQQVQERIADLQAQFALEEAENARQRGVKLQRLAEDQTSELATLSKNHQLKLAQIDQQAIKERQQQEANYIKVWNKLAEAANNGQNQIIKTHRDGQATIEREMRAWYNRMAAQFGTVGSTSGGNMKAGRVQPTAYALGTGNIPATGMALVHQGEAVLSQPVAEFMRHMIGSTNPSQQQMVAALGGGGGGRGNGNRSMSTGDVHINQQFPNDTGLWTKSEILDFGKQAVLLAFKEALGE